MNTLLTCLILVFIAIVFFKIFANKRNSFESFDSEDNIGINSLYGFIDDNISHGNPLSWSNKTNPYIDVNEKSKRDAIIYQGNGIPLPHEDHPTAPINKSMFYFSNYSCRPECCLYSPYSCSNGCVCWEAPPEKNDPVIQSLRTTPSS
jgi:hypothetical protein